MIAWETLAVGAAPDGVALELRRRGPEFLIRAGGRDLMSSDDERSSRALAELAFAELSRPPSRVMIGGLGMGFTLRAALDAAPADAVVEVVELVADVVAWNRGPLADLAGRPHDDARTRIVVADVADRIAACEVPYDAILLDVDNGPDALAHDANARLYDADGLARARAALRPGGVLAVWSFSDDPGFTRKCRAAGFATRTQRVSASRRGRGRHHTIWLARRQ